MSAKTWAFSPILPSRLNFSHHQIEACLMVPIRYRGTSLGLLELHQPDPHIWKADEVTLVETISTQVAVGLDAGPSL